MAEFAAADVAPCGALLDNDAIIKVCCYALAAEVVEVLAAFGPTATLGVTRLIVTKQMKRSSRIADKPAALAELQHLLAELGSVEPSEEELVLAAEMEAAAMAAGLPFDSGESQILAVTLHRALPLMVTGDKRAITAIEAVTVATGHADRCGGRVACLEQVVMAALVRWDPEHLQARVCREPHADSALSFVFLCASGSAVTDNDARDGLKSYITHLRSAAGGVLYARDDLSVIP